jgi:UDP-glucose 4-epimerase
VNSIIVLGSSGFIGNNIVRQFLHSGYKVLGVDIVERVEAGRDGFTFVKESISPQLMQRLLQNYQVDAVVHAAGRASVYASFETPALDFSENSITTFHILDAIRQFSPATKLIFLSSAAVYGNPLKLPISEIDPLNPISPYGFHKLQSEMIVREFHQCFGVSSIILRIFSCYGEGQRKLFLWDLCNKATSGKEVILKGVGKESRDFIHVSDVAGSIEHLLRADIQGLEIFNLASGQEYTISDTASMFNCRLGNDNIISFEGIINQGNPDNWVANVSKLSSYGFSAGMEFGKGIEKYIDWFKTISANGI